MKVLFLNRSKSFDGFSFESLFTTIKNHLISFKYQDFYDKTYPTFQKNIKAIKKIRADVIHLTGGLGYYSLFLPTKNTILTIHDTNHYEHDLKGLKKWLFGLLFYKIPYRNTYSLTTVSNHTKSRLIKLFGFKENKIVVIPNCYPDDFKASPKKHLNKSIKILQIGTKENKNIIRLINAIVGLDVQLTIIGKLSPKLISLLERNKINYINKYNLNRKGIYREYINTDIVAFISLYEGFGLPIVEANAVGRAVITSKTSSMPEVGGNAAHYVNPYDVDDIKDGIVKVINDNEYRNQLISNGYRNIEKYNPIEIARKYEQLYQKIINN